VAAAGSTNGSMQAQIAAMRQLLGEKATEGWLQGLVDNQVTFFGGHTDVRKAVGAGEFKLGLVNHYYFYLQQAEGSPVGVIYPDQEEGQIGLITTASAAAIVQGAGNLSAAQAFLDYLVSKEGQEIFARLNFEYPLVPAAATLPILQPLKDFRLAELNRLKQRWNSGDIRPDERLGLPLSAQHIIYIPASRNKDP
jgi:iron(III) transport system substrate-binding protein